MNCREGPRGQPMKLITTLLEKVPVRAPAMIVTIYGDIVVPRGGILWMGTLIEICARLGISETLVRTAVSRLVSSGRLVGERHGRRSFYRLADAARAEFDLAARLLSTPLPAPQGWLIHYLPGYPNDEVRSAHLAALGGDFFIRPNHSYLPPLPKLTFEAAVTNGGDEFPALAQTMWPLESFAQDYDALIAQFSPLEEAIGAGRNIASSDAVTARLLLVHAYRNILLRDPLLPADCLPVNWHGGEARDLFTRLYLALSPQADAFVGEIFQGLNAKLPESTPETASRLRSLSGRSN
jgi:phenylacetic acid degradation operon negative regulatory protein